MQATRRSEVEGARARRAGPALVLMLLVVSPAATRGDDAGLDKQVHAVLAAPGDAIHAGVWFGVASGEPIYELDPRSAMPAASVIKTALLIELFAAHAGHLDDPLGAAADAALVDDKHPAMAPFSVAQRNEIRAALHGATVRTVGAIMMGSKKASNVVYNAAANLAIASLGGPSEATAKLHARDPAFGGIVVGRYMLASRTASGDNEATPGSLAAVLASIATGKVPGGVDPATVDAIAHAMMQTSDPVLGVRRYKEGNLDSDPMVVIKTGFYLRGNGKPPLVYVVGVALTAKPTGARDQAHRRLEKLTDAVQALLRSSASH